MASNEVLLDLAEEPEEEPILTEEINLSGDEDTEGISKTITLTIDSNSRIVSKEGRFPGSRNTTPIDENVTTSSYLEVNDEISGNTSCEELDASDEESVPFPQLTINELGIKGMDITAGSEVSSVSKFNPDPINFLEECMTDNEDMSDEEGATARNTYSPIRLNQKPQSGISVAGLVKGIANKSLSIANSFSSTILLKNQRGLQDGSDVPLMTCMEFLKAEASDGGETDIDNLSAESGDETEQMTIDLKNVSLPESVDEDMLRHRGSDIVSKEDRRPSWTVEYLSDDEASAMNSCSNILNRKTKAKRLRKISRGEAYEASNTDEEFIDEDGRG